MLRRPVVAPPFRGDNGDGFSQALRVQGAAVVTFVTFFQRWQREIDGYEKFREPWA